MHAVARRVSRSGTATLGSRLLVVAGGGGGGKDAQSPIVTCTTKRKRTTCTTTFATGSKITLFRNGRPVASGTVSRGKLELTTGKRLAAGTYALRAVRGRREQRIVVSVRRR